MKPLLLFIMASGAGAYRPIFWNDHRRPRGSRRLQSGYVYAQGMMDDKNPSKSAAPSLSPTVSFAPTRSPAPSSSPTQWPTKSPTNRPTLYPTQRPTQRPSARPSSSPSVSMEPSASPAPTADGFQTSVVEDVGRTDYTSVCDDPVPDGFRVVEQLFVLEYTMFLPSLEVNPAAKVIAIEQRLHPLLAKAFLQCNFTAVRSFFVNAILSSPADELLGECIDESQPDAVCYRAQGSLSAGIVYSTRRRRRRRLQQTQLTDNAVVAEFGQFLTALFGSDALLDDNIIALQFSGFTNLFDQATYGGDTTTPTVENDRTVSGATSGEVNDESSAYSFFVAYILVGVAVAILVLATLLVVRKQRRRSMVYKAAEEDDNLYAMRTLESESDDEVLVLSDKAKMHELNDLRLLEESLNQQTTPDFPSNVEDYYDPDGSMEHSSEKVLMRPHSHSRSSGTNWYEYAGSFDESSQSRPKAPRTHSWYERKYYSPDTIVL